MWRNVCLLLMFCSVVAVHGSEVECTKRLDVISPATWMSLRKLDVTVLASAKLVNVASVQDSTVEGFPWSTHIAWHTADSKTYLQGTSPCFDSGRGSRGRQELYELGRRTVKDIQFGHTFIAILATDGTVWTAGCNEEGRLGHHGNETRPVISQVMGLPPVAKIAVGSNNVIVMAYNGTLYSWGNRVALGYKSDKIDNPFPKKISLAHGITSKAKDVCCNHVQCTMITEDLRAFSWGPPGHIGRPYSGESIPELVAGIPEDQHITKVACGYVHTLAVTKSGRLYGWGFNTYGNLVNTEDTLPYATQLDMGGMIIRDVAVGKWTSLVVTDSRDSYYFGPYWSHAWYRPQPTVHQVVFPRDILATVLFIGNPFDDEEETNGAVSLGCK